MGIAKIAGQLPALLIACVAVLSLPGVASASSFSIVVLPDTQHYVDSSSRVEGFMAQTAWIADNVDARNIAFVSHVGDVVQHGDRAVEWERAEQAMANLHGRAPYGISIGDHDYEDEESRHSGADFYLAHFGPSRYEGFSWYGGSAPDGKSHYQRFEAGGREFIHISLEWEAHGSTSDPNSAMGWAQTVLDTNSRVPTIISTHSYLWDKPGQEGRTNGIEEDDGNGNSGELLWSELIKNNPQVFMVLGGNFHKARSQFDPRDPSGTSDDGEFHQVSTNLAGLPVYEMLANYQDYPNGGDGWLRLIEFQEGGGASGLDRIAVSTYSPTLQAYQTDSRSQFHFDVSFASRFDSIPAKHNLHRVVFNRGDGVYVWKKKPSTTYNADGRVKIDSSYSGTNSEPMPRQGLIRFDIELGKNGIPAGANIVSAELRARITDSGNGFRLHRMVRPWDEDTVTWSSLDDGIDADGSDAMAVADHETLRFLAKGESPGYSVFDVTESVRAWANGQDNQGWALMPQGSNQLNLESFAGGYFEPELVVDYALPGTDMMVFTSGQDAYVSEQAPDTNRGGSTRLKVDSEDGTSPSGEPYPIQSLLQFDIAGIPAGSRIQRAEIRLRLTDPGSAIAIHRMLVPWREDDVTWNSLSGGIDADGTDAVAAPGFVTDFLYELDSQNYTCLDVTESVQAWVDGAPNHGWALLPRGPNKLWVESLQGALKPQLVISYIPGP